jgi:glutamate dehydrogenase (NADP+)
MPDLVEQTLSRLDAAARAANASAAVVRTLMYPPDTVRRKLSFVRDDGSRRTVDAVHSRHGSCAPDNGWLELDPSATAGHVEGRALLGTLKAGVLDLVFNGTAGAIQVDPSLLSDAERRQIDRRFAMRMDAPLVPGSAAALARGGIHALRELADDLRLPRRASVSICGFGRAGQHVARLLVRQGHVIVAASDSKVAVSALDGIAASKLLAAKTSGLLEAVAAERDVARGPREAALTLACDILVLAGRGVTLSAANAGAVRAPVVLELADGTIDEGGDATLESKGVIVLPDLLAASGAAIQRHLHPRQSGRIDAYGEAAADGRAAEMIRAAMRSAWALSRAEGWTMRQAALALACRRIRRRT